MFYLVYGILILVAFILQGAVIPYTLFYDVIPDLLLIIVTILAIKYGNTTGGVVGFITGFVQDLFSGGLFGINAISKTIIGYLFGFLKNNIYHQNLLVHPLIAFLSTIINQMLIVFFTDYLLTSLTMDSALKLVIIPLAIYNSILALVIYPIIHKIDSYLIRRKSK